MIIISARITLDPKDVDRYITGARQVVVPTLAEKGCIRYSIALDITAPNIVCIFEEWEAEEDLMAHLSTPHIQTFLALSADLSITNMELMKYEISASGPLVLDA
ncbi:antibiotic biosynthesis monooxygenase [Aestuariicella hydrocarbonica]|uniref:Antibiotic biosynthesis monooxygenase n=1 Tax=Pseudomaricurvus hydrocarbonicus TaxID=1470433 RepID=A0A9E5JWN2_9GAMM|nr:putative quinol monooxygenase [Aestuariicella hydrocarbonica]NHO66856.1 antibiotic biosynthesis monooxygenase [Aestuariicella hydrocarbonica]